MQPSMSPSRGNSMQKKGTCNGSSGIDLRVVFVLRQTPRRQSPVMDNLCPV